jgi:hypothetical protein
MSVATLLDRLTGVRKVGPGRWIAICPGHDDGTPSLSIRELDDGRVLVHDFAGCDVGDVLAALGLELTDLFPRGAAAGYRRPPSSSRVPASDVLGLIDHEAHVVSVIAADLLEHRVIYLPAWQRLAQAVRRIGNARAMAAPIRVKRS